MVSIQTNKIVIKSLRKQKKIHYKNGLYSFTAVNAKRRGWRRRRRRRGRRSRNSIWKVGGAAGGCDGVDPEEGR